MRELTFLLAGRLEWRERPEPIPRDAPVRPFVTVD